MGTRRKIVLRKLQEAAEALLLDGAARCPASLLQRLCCVHLPKAQLGSSVIVLKKVTRKQQG